MNRLTAAVAGLVILIGIGNVSAQDWPQWRGPNRDGKLTGFSAPATWPKELTQKWKIEVGLGDATPAFAAGKLYAFGRKDANEVVTCIDAANGKVLWTSSYPADYVVSGPPAGHPGPRSSPIVADGKVCTLGVGGILSCFDAATSKLLWRKQSDADYMGTPYHFESSMSPIVVDGTCIVYVGGKPQGAPVGQGAIVAFDLAGGQAKWKCDCNVPAPSSPVVATLGGVKQLVTINGSQVIGVGLADHTVLWQVPFKARPTSSTTPVIDGETVIVTGETFGTVGIKVTKAGDKFTAEQAWANKDAQAGCTFTTPVLRDGLLFGYAATKLCCLSVKDGKVLWADTVTRGRSAAIVDAGSCMIALPLNGELLVYLPTDKQYTEMARYKVGDPDPKAEIWAHPILSGKNIFVKDKTSVTCWGI
jgi:outer membrane protein assembly factor BamB